MATLPHIPFAKLPRREYKKGPVSMGGDPKPRMDVHKFLNGDEEIEEYDQSNFEDISDASSESSGYDLMQHVANLLPGELEDGKKPRKEADSTHLQELKVTRKRPDRLKYVKRAYNWVMTLRARERERRKHYILKEYEQRIKEFDALQKKLREDAMLEEEALIKKEAKERQERIERNSRKKKNKLQMTKDFDAKLEQRIKDERRINFYCDKLPGWAIEGIYKSFAEKEAAEIATKIAQEAAIAHQEAADTQAIIDRDRAVLEEDRQITVEIEQMMVQYGMLHFDKPVLEQDDEKINYILEQNRLENDDDANRRKRKKQKLRRKEASAERRAKKNNSSSLPSISGNSRPSTAASRPSTANSVLSGVGETILDLEVSQQTNFDVLRRDLHRSRFGGKGKSRTGGHRQVEEAANAFPDIDFQDTGDIRIVYGHHLKTLGALAFASELAQGACPFLEEFRFQQCDIRDPGFLRLIQGVRLGNLSSLRVLDFRGNHLTALSIDYFRDICAFGVFNNLEEMLLNNNDLKDAGIEAIIRVMLLGHFRSLYALQLQRNSITDKGFRSLMTMVSNIHDRYCPNLNSLKLELNLITPECKREFSPLPSYVAV